MDGETMNSEVTPELTHWTSRVLESGHFSESWKEPWRQEAYATYESRLRSAGYPCFFGQTAEIRGEMLYTFVARRRLDAFAESLRTFVKLIGTDAYARSSMIGFFEPDSSIATHDAFIERFWGVLQYLHERDTEPAVERTPEDPLWEFSFEGTEMFVVAASPTYRLRRSRNLGPGMVLIFQPRKLFLDMDTGLPIPAEVRHRLHKRMLAYDGMALHPDIGFYGDEANFEWKQYALPDDNAAVTGRCPFHARALSHQD